MVVGILAPLSVLWNRIVIRRDVRGDLGVSMWRLFPRSREWPQELFGRITVTAREMVLRSRRRSRVRSVGWRWHVRIDATGPGDGAPGAPLVEFCPDHQKDRPAVEGRMSDRVGVFVRWLAGATGLPVAGPVMAPHLARGRGPLLGMRHMVRGAPATLERRVYDGLDEMPAELRQRAEQMMAQARARCILPGEVISSERIVVRDAQGRVHTYHSIDEMPPEVRALYERGRGE